MSDDNLDLPVAAPAVETAIETELNYGKVDLPMPEPVSVIAEEPTPVAPEPVPAPEPVAPAPQVVAQVAPVIVSGKTADDVYLSRCIYKNKYERKSLTVHHLQRRLNELGYKDAYTDKDGWFGELTKLAVENFQKDRGLKVTGLVDERTFKNIFDGDANVNIII